MIMKQRFVKLITILLALVGLVLICRFLFHALYPYGPCDLPRRTVAKDDLVGEWRAVYSQQGVSDPVAGTVEVISDTLHLVDPDGKLTSLAAVCFARSPEGAWFTCRSALRGNTYFLNGEETLRFWENGTYQQVFVSETYSYTSPLYQWELVTNAYDSPKLKLYDGKYFPAGITQAFNENGIILRPQHSDRNLAPRPSRSELIITYPIDGFTVLYPRICSGELSLTQMMHQSYDADDFTVKNPVFAWSDD